MRATILRENSTAKVLLERMSAKSLQIGAGDDARRADVEYLICSKCRKEFETDYVLFLCHTLGSQGCKGGVLIAKNVPEIKQDQDQTARSSHLADHDDKRTDVKTQTKEMGRSQRSNPSIE